jgi:sugar phosphate isomerase/epimerase
VGGADPVEYLRKYQSRVRSVHMKEVKTVSPYDGTAIGEGIVDFKGIYGLFGDNAIYIVEQEGLRDMETWEGLRRSVEYLKKL